MTPDSPWLSESGEGENFPTEARKSLRAIWIAIHVMTPDEAINYVESRIARTMPGIDLEDCMKRRDTYRLGDA